MKNTSSRNLGEFVFSLVLVAIATSFLMSASDLPMWAGRSPGAGQFPYWCSAILLGLVILQLIIQLCTWSRTKDGETAPLAPVLLIGFAVAGFAVVLQHLGFLAASWTVFLITNVLIFRKRDLMTLVWSLVFAAIAWFLFGYLLQVQFPR